MSVTSIGVDIAYDAANRGWRISVDVVDEHGGLSVCDTISALTIRERSHQEILSEFGRQFNELSAQATKGLADRAKPPLTPAAP